MKQLQVSLLMFCNFSIDCENPWDGATATNSRRSVICATRAVRVLVVAALSTLLAYSLPLHSRAQSTPPPEELIEGGHKRVTITISQDALHLADDYLEALQQLQTLTHSYTSFFQTLQGKLSADEQQSLNLISVNLEKGNYIENLDGLQADVTGLLQALAVRENELKENNERVYRLSRSLRQELEALKGFLQEDVASQLQQNRKMSQAIQAYLRGRATLAEVSTEQHGKIITVIVNYPDTTIQYLRPFDKEAFVSINEKYSPPSVPHPPMITIDHDLQFVHKRGGIGVVRKLVDSISVTSNSEPIHITNPIGDMKIFGWDQDKVLVYSEIELSAGSREKVKELSQQIELQLGSKDDGICAELVLPNITDPQIKILNCTFQISAPENNPLIVHNSFGDVVIRKIHNNVKLNASNSHVTMKDIKGHTEVVNSMGEVDLSNVTGSIKVANSFGPVKVSRSSGDMEIENSFSSISLTRCEGNAVIRSSGHVEILRHSGSILIGNTNGEVEVTELDGDLVAQNSYQLLSVQDIFGSAKVENANGAIEAKNIHGEFSANNSFGPIYASLLTGPIHFACQNGIIDLTVKGDLKGPSSISSSFGAVKLVVSPDSDVLFTATAVGGDIQSYFPMAIEEEGATKTAKFSFGEGKNSFTVSGNNSTIIISEAR